MSILLRSLSELLRRGEPEAALAPEESAEPIEMRALSRVKTNEEVLLQWIDQDDAERSEPAVIFERSRRGAGLRFSVALPVGLSILLTRKGEGPVKAIVRHSRELEDGFHLGVRLIGRELRRFDRHPVDAEASLHWSSVRNGQQTIVVRVTDSTAEGVQLDAPCSIPEEMMVRLGHGGWHRLGVISYCKERAGRFVAGVQFTTPPKSDESAEAKD